ncbi:MAG TPA: YggS family pyridoxal phosphate-dependent enzyme [Clostridiales bacterium]|nr:YggS family pyridoxal phosphate-dependent enzyme [Clostridiales bacterium]
MMKNNIDQIEQRIQAACERAGRDRSEVTLIAVSKTKPNEALLEAYSLGMRHFGENKVQELKQKYEELNEGFTGVQWHLIGHLQRNKVKYIVDKAALIHSVDSIRLAEQIEEEAAKRGLICDILVEVNIAGEDTKYGVAPEEVLPFLQEIRPLTHIRPRGLMTVAPFVENPEKNREYFKKLRQLYVDIKSKNIDNIGNGTILLNEAEAGPESYLEHFNVLSMGMTGDFEVAIEEGATMVRIGTGIFGERDYSNKSTLGKL